MRRRLRVLLVMVLLLVSAIFLGFAWSVTHPTIGAANNSPASAVESKLWSFGFVGDTHLGMTDDVVEPIFKRFQEAQVEFVVHLGDMVDQGESVDQWRSFISLAKKYRLRIMPTLGNHDVLRSYNDAGQIPVRQYFPWLPATYYHFRHRGLNFVMLNTEVSLRPSSEQRACLATQLELHPGTTIVCCHRPVFTCSRRDWANVFSRQLWLHSAIRRSDVALVLSGHNHYYERTFPLDGITYITSGGGTPNTYPQVAANNHTATFVAGKPHFGLVDVYPDTLDVQILDLAGKIIDRFAIELRSAKHPPGHQANPGSLELPALKTLPQFSSDESGVASPAPGDEELPRPW